MNINTNIINAMDYIKEHPSTFGGHAFEDYVYKKFRQFLRTKNDSKVTCRVDTSGNIMKVSGYDEHKGTHIIEQPNGSQNWPDFLIMRENKCLCFEIKTGKGGKITWNSGFPKNNCIYIYKDMDDHRVYYFLGVDRLEGVEENVSKLKEDFEKEFKLLAQKLFEEARFNPLKDKNISHYARSMWNDSTNYSRHKNKDVWTNRVYDYIRTLKWDNK